MCTSPKPRPGILLVALLFTFAIGCGGDSGPGELAATGGTDVVASDSYDDLLGLFEEWREFVRPQFTDGVPDYGAVAMSAQYAELPAWQSRLTAIDPTGVTSPATGVPA